MPFDNLYVLGVLLVVLGLISIVFAEGLAKITHYNNSMFCPFFSEQLLPLYKWFNIVVGILAILGGLGFIILGRTGLVPG